MANISNTQRNNCSDPYALAKRALLKYRKFKKGELTEKDIVLGLYFQNNDTKEIAAVVRTVPENTRAVWFEIIRIPGGFGIKNLKVSKKNPDMSTPVEGH